MNILTIPYIAGGLSHLIPLYVLQQKYLRNNTGINNHFLVNDISQKLLAIQGINFVPVNYTLKENLLKPDKSQEIKEDIMNMEKMAFDMVQPSLIIEDTSMLTPLIAEKNKIPRISIQRTGIFRSIDRSYRNEKHVHSLSKGNTVNASENPSVMFTSHEDFNDPFLTQYEKPKAKIIPGIPSIERLPENIENRESYFYSGPLLVMDKPSENLSVQLEEFLNDNRQKPIVLITTGTIDKTPIENFIEFFVQRNYAVITTCQSEINERYSKQILYRKLLPLHYICGISNLVIHQCGSGMYHYPIMHRVPSLTLGTQCYDREDIALRLQELGVSAHIPHPDDDPGYWNIFLEKVEKYENNSLINYEIMDHLRNEINDTMANFNMEKVIEYALEYKPDEYIDA